MKKEGEKSILLKVIIDHIKYCFENIIILFNTFTEDDFSKIVNGFPLWQQFYHMLNSIDRILADPDMYDYPSFHIDGLNNLEIKPETQVSKRELYDYYKKIETESNNYLEDIDESMLEKKSNHKTLYMTKLDHILAQQRHMTWHIGYLQSCAKVLYGHTPEHILVKDKTFTI